MQNPDLVINLNLSSASIADESLADFILPLLDSAVAKPEQLCFEMSEASFNHNLANATRLIERLQTVGCGFALDNFGSGLASFAALKDLSIDYVKIDSHLIRNVCSDKVDLAMVESIHAMAQLLGIRSVAENVDSEAVIAKIKSIGIDYAQGYHLADLLRLDDLGNVAEDIGIFENQLN
jgi:EAL domain-containing protein (putative c-di-GMP-specific phosphodiesterase class I)